MTNHTKHENHQIEMIEGPFDYKYTGKTRDSSIMKHIYSDAMAVSHPGKLMCTTCKIQLKWLNKLQVDLYKQEYKSGMTYAQFNKRINDYIHSTPTKDEAYIFLAVPYNQKDEVKKYGASWDPYHKLWYTTVRRKNVEKLIPWMMPDDIQKLKV